MLTKNNNVSKYGKIGVKSSMILIMQGLCTVKLVFNSQFLVKGKMTT
jgi:hypothetical protein